jgi:hypothetical protein
LPLFLLVVLLSSDQVVNLVEGLDDRLELLLLVVEDLGVLEVFDQAFDSLQAGICQVTYLNLSHNLPFQI